MYIVRTYTAPNGCVLASVGEVLLSAIDVQICQGISRLDKFIDGGVVREVVHTTYLI